MKIIMPDEYLKEYPDSNLEQYISYLEQQRNEIVSALESAKNMEMPENFIENIKKEFEKIDIICDIVKQLLLESIIKEIDKLSLEDLKEIKLFDENIFDQVIKSNEDLQKKLLEKIELLKRKVDNLEDKDTKVRRQHQMDDADIFFGSSDLKDFYEKWITTDIKESTLVDIFKEVTKNLIKNETKQSEFINKLIKNINDLKRIYGFYPDMSPILSAATSTKSISEVFEAYLNFNDFIKEMNNFERKNTKFFKSLDLKIQDKLINENFEGNTFDELATLHNKTKANQSINDIEVSLIELSKLEIELEQLKQLFDELQTKKDDIIKDNNDEKKLKEKLKEFVTESYSKEYKNKTYEELLEAMNAIENHILTLRELSAKLYKLNQDNSTLNTCLDPSYEGVYQRFDASNELLLLEAVGKYSTSVEPFYLTEKKRMTQIEKMSGFIERLEKKEKEYRTEEARKAGLFGKTEKENNLIRIKNEYDLIAKEMIDFFNLNPNILIVSPQQENSTELKNIEDFNTVSALQKFYNPTQNIWNSVKTTLAPDGDFDVIMNNNMIIQQVLIKSLFSVQKENGFYKFTINADERNILKIIQEQFFIVAKTNYEFIKKEEERVEKEAETYTDYDKITIQKILELIHGKNPGFETIKFQIDENNKEIERIKHILIANKELCQELGIAIPTLETPTESNTVDKDIIITEILNNYGFQTLEEYNEYKKFLESIKYMPVSDETIHSAIKL